MEIQHKSMEYGGSFFAEKNGKRIANMTYTFENPAVMVINHTEVEPSLREQNKGLQLVNEAIAFARENKIKIKASCSFAKAVFDKHADKYKNIIFEKI